MEQQQQIPSILSGHFKKGKRKGAHLAPRLDQDDAAMNLGQGSDADQDGWN
jgi:hypothetical protein